jgi:tryptophan 7-halogenase
VHVGQGNVPETTHALLAHRGPDARDHPAKLADALARAGEAMPTHQDYIAASCGAA